MKTYGFILCNRNINFVTLHIMARKNKKILEKGIDKRDVGYFSTPDFIARYLCDEMLRLKQDGTKVLDPAIGSGELIDFFLAAGMKVDGFDIIDYPHRSEKAQFYNEDFIKYYISNKEELIKKGYDYIIMNPPYNCHEHLYIVTNKTLLLSHFKTGTFNMYALFIEAAIEIAKEGCIIGAILPDSILFTSAYNQLRNQILHNCEITQIILCPTHLFRSKGANVNTCILLLRKGRGTSNTTKIANRPPDITSFKIILQNRKLNEVRTDDICLRINGTTNIFALDMPPEILKIISENPRLGEQFECGGGVSTGNNFLYTSVEKRDGFTVPFFSNVCTRFTTQPRLFLCDNYRSNSQGTRKFIVRHPERLCEEGIVCSGIGKHFFASHLPESGVTGVNAAIWPGKENIYWILAYLNCSLVSYLAKGIIARGHITTIGNVSSLPLLNFTNSEKKSLGWITKRVLIGKLEAEAAVKKIDRIVYRNINASKMTRKMIGQFCSDIIHLV